jgi:hypothetical protein
MKYFIALVVGMITGVLMLALLMYYNPFSAASTVSPLSVTDERILALQFSAVPEEMLLYTNDGESTSLPHPDGAAELWEAPVRDTRVQVALLADSRGVHAGIGVKFASNSEETRVLNSEAIVDSAWHLYLPERGTLFIGQRENYWSYLRDIVVKARTNSASNWRGAWTAVTTSGPNALGTGRVIGGSGEFAGMESEAVESLRATAYSAEQGPVALDGSLTVSLPDPAPDRAARTD